MRNTTQAAVLKESRIGAARDARSFVWLYVGSRGGRCHRGGRRAVPRHPSGGEIGHSRVVERGRGAAAARIGCLEVMAWAVPSPRRRQPSPAPQPSALRRRRLAARRRQRRWPVTVSTHHRRAGRWLGRGISQLVDIVDPEMVVVGGGVARAGDLLLDPIRQVLNDDLLHTEDLPVVRSSLIGQAEITGAVLLAIEGGDLNQVAVDHSDKDSASRIIGVDSSTQSSKIEVRDLPDSGEVIARASNPHWATTPPRSEQHPSSWWDAVEPLLDEHGGGAAAVSIAGQQHGMVVLDRFLEPLRPAKLWKRHRVRSTSPMARAVGGRAMGRAHRRPCSVPAITVTKLAWLRENEPQVHERVARKLLPHDWLTLRLTGEVMTDRATPRAPATGHRPPVIGFLGDPRSRRPRSVGLPDRARAHGGGRKVAGAVVGPGTGDNMAAAGLGLRPGDLAVSIGTSTVFAVTSQPAADPTGAWAGFLPTPRGTSSRSSARSTPRRSPTLLARLLGVTHEELTRLAPRLPPEPGVGTVPYLDGERTPNRPDATGMLAGIRSDVSREQVA